MKKKAFTLIEILITTCILAVLFVLIFKTYNDITKITTKIDSEKNLYNEVLFLTQTIQNLSDHYNLDYNTY
jgi:prepilin-type N-terminal cleavage/methylation domain-containing protein